MKRILFFSLIFLASCDMIEDPVLPFTISYRADLYGPAPTFDAATDFSQNVLIEDFTAHKCGNCPDAGVIADEMLEAHPGDVVLVAVHAGPLADASSAPFITDWTNAESNYFWDQLDFQANPLGRVNRKGGVGNFFAPTVWVAETNALLANSSPLALQMSVNFQADNNHLNIHVNGQFNANFPGSSHLVLLVTESNLVDYQLWYGHEPEVVPDYDFKHVLRGSVSGPEGLNFSDNALSGDEIQKDYTYTWNNEWVPENSHVVALVYNDATGEIMNVMEAHVE